MALVAGTYTLLVFITPMTLEPGTVPELSGRANLIDYATVDGWGSGGQRPWGDMNSDTINSPRVVFRPMDHGPLVALVNRRSKLPSKI